LSLTGWLYLGLCDEDKRLDKAKANEATIQVILLQMQKSQDQARTDAKEAAARQDTINRENNIKFQKNQDLILKMITKP